MDIPRYRIGNDLTVLWAICNNDGTPFDLSGKVVRLFVTNDKGITEVKPTITSNKDGSANNVILWNYLGDDQKVLGKHTLTVEILTSDDKRKIKRDVCDAFTLVSRSESEETGGDANFLDSGSIYLSTKLDVYRFGNAKVEIGENGNWFIDGNDTGKTAMGGGQGLVNIIYSESDLGSEFNQDSKIDTFNAHAINAIYKALKAISIDDIKGISLSDLAAHDVLAYNGSRWINIPFREILNMFGGPSESGSNPGTPDTPDTPSGDSYWTLGADGKLYSKYDIYVKGNAIIEGDTSSGGEGQDTPASGTVIGVIVNGIQYTDVNAGILDLSEAFNRIDISDQLDDFATKAEVKTVQDEVDNIQSILGLEETAAGYINTWNEVVAFLDGYKNSDDLAAILSDMNKEIAKKVAQLDFDELVEEVEDNKNSITALDTRLKAEEDVTTTYKKWWADLSGVVKVENGKVKINTDLIVSGDTSSEGSGSDSPALGTVTSIKVNNTPYNPNSAGVIDLSEAFNSIDVSEQLANYALTDYVNTQFALVNSALSGKQDALGYTPLSTSGGAIGSASGSSFPLDIISANAYTGISFYTSGGRAYFRYQGGSTWGVTDNGWNNSYTLYHTGNFNPANYLPLSGGTLTKDSSNPLIIKRTGSGDPGVEFYKDSTRLGSLGLNSSYEPYYYNANKLTICTLIHSGNIGSQSVAAAKVLSASYSENINYSSYTSHLKLIYSTDGNAVANGFPFDYVSGLSVMAGYVGWQMVTYGDWTYDPNPRFRSIGGGGNWSPWKTIAFTDSTVEAANKLATPRTIWGQSFDGSGNVSGELTLGYSILRGGDSKNALELASSTLTLGYSYRSLNTTIYGGNITFAREGAYSMFINSSGNVTFGASDLAGTTYKMSVDGKVHIRSTAGAAMNEGAGSLIVGNGAVLMIDANDIQAKTNGTTAGPLYINDWGGNVILCGQNKGNVLIGTATDSGYKLDVNGDISAMSALRIGGCGTSYCGLYPNSQITSGGSSSRLWLYNESGIAIYASALEILTSTSITGNLVVSGDTSSGSDIRFKDIIEHKTIKIEHIAKAPLFTFKWNDREDDTIHLGTSAQYWENVCSELVSGSDFKTLNYASLGVGMGISLAKKVVNHEERIKMLELEIKRLKEEQYGC